MANASSGSASICVPRSVFNPIGLSLLTQSVAKEDRGAIVSSMEVVLSASRTLSPWLAGMALDHGAGYVSLLCIAQLVLACVPLLQQQLTGKADKSTKGQKTD
eukprot:TRINITY_DN4909_c0_g1_i2.p3 TRINITY_DN4909_c0_g1~~TRINITY_DN4909_c0_g1_i2.p3  ORF type:complete len:103 (+),score=15.01 TRINITY_DN4909_c0_g1_i2:1154-1462(+)